MGGSRKLVAKGLQRLAGKRLSAVEREGRAAVVRFGEAALTLRCSWRLSKPAEILVGSADFPDVRRFKSLVAALPLRRSALSVTRVLPDDVGGFRLVLSRDWALEVFPAEAPSAGSELWRLQVPGADDFIVRP